jgi:hypothetical protein
VTVKYQSKCIAVAATLGQRGRGWFRVYTYRFSLARWQTNQSDQATKRVQKISFYRPHSWIQNSQQLRLLGFHQKITLITSDLRLIYRVSHVERSIFWEVTVSAILSKKMYMYMCPISNCFRDRAISLYSSKIIDKKVILRTASNTDNYCSSDKFGTVYLV